MGNITAIMDIITLRSAPRHLATSRAVGVFVAFVVLLVPVLLVLLNSARTSPWPELHLIAATAPAVGLLLALVMLVIRLRRRSRPVLLVDDHVTLPATGVRFPLERLDHLQLYTRHGVPRLVLLPGHVPERMPSRAVAPYTVTFPEGANYLPYELVDLLRGRAGDVGVDKLGTV
ncbi:MAG: hypothetical protein GX859_04195 [Corynebacterium humireducens]|uniref:Uncharacterized protein n=2 Tax=Corynebacterium humireducens TaxID=1223514 RepID=A0A0B5D462_9CORY|nr:hypothetical protein [Corynebacterium humireducens]AJE33775.1 hypothetical protein B842_09630 [Corynebacterium humireducens NBRC 106098 = DSM 45392]NLA55489.1 hypothetical protein [Corynebacterium humireducens]